MKKDDWDAGSALDVMQPNAVHLHELAFRPVHAFRFVCEMPVDRRHGDQKRWLRTRCQEQRSFSRNVESERGAGEDGLLSRELRVAPAIIWIAPKCRPGMNLRHCLTFLKPSVRIL